MALHFFLSNENSITEVIQIFEYLSIFSGLKPNKSKCENNRYWCSRMGPNVALWYGICKPKK